MSWIKRIVISLCGMFGCLLIFWLFLSMEAGCRQGDQNIRNSGRAAAEVGIEANANPEITRMGRRLWLE